MPGPAAVTGATQDVRFAVVMSGGVSLAVWMGGVAREVNLLQQASDSRGPDETAGAPLDWDGRSRRRCHVSPGSVPPLTPREGLTRLEPPGTTLTLDAY